MREAFQVGRAGALWEAVGAVDGQLAGALGSPLVRSADDLLAALYANAAAVFLTPAVVFRQPSPPLDPSRPCTVRVTRPLSNMISESCQT